MELKRIPHRLTVCKVEKLSDIDTAAEFYFIGKTDEELSLVCRTEDTPVKTIEREDGWRGFRIQGCSIFPWSGYCPNYPASSRSTGSPVKEKKPAAAAQRSMKTSI